MMSKCILMAVVLGVAHGIVTKMPCNQKATLQPAMGGTTYLYPSNCNSQIIVKFMPDTAKTMSLLFTDVSFTNQSMVDEGAMLTVTVEDQTGIIMICDSKSMNNCFDRASSANTAIVTFDPTNVTSNGYGVQFTATPMMKSDVKGYVDCRCANSDNTTDGYIGTTDVTVEANSTMMLDLTAAPCAGSHCMWMLMTDMDQTLNIGLNDVSSIYNNTMTLPANLYGSMIDVYGTMKPVAKPQIDVNMTTMMNTGMMYSSQFIFVLSVPYMSFADMTNHTLMPQSMSSLKISAVQQPNDTVIDRGMVMLNDTTNSWKAIAPQQPYDFPNVVYQWEIMVNNKDKSKYNLFWEQNSCSGLTSSNTVDVRKTSSKGQILKSFDTCTKAMELKSMSTGEKTVFVQYTRSNASLVTGDWTYTFSSTEINSSSMTTGSMLTIVLAAVIAMFK